METHYTNTLAEPSGQGVVAWVQVIIIQLGGNRVPFHASAIIVRFCNRFHADFAELVFRVNRSWNVALFRPPERWEWRKQWFGTMIFPPFTMAYWTQSASLIGTLKFVQARPFRFECTWTLLLWLEPLLESHSSVDGVESWFHINLHSMHMKSTF